MSVLLWIVGWIASLAFVYWLGYKHGWLVGGGKEERKRWKQWDEWHEHFQRAREPAILHFVDPRLVEAAERVHAESREAENYE